MRLGWARAKRDPCAAFGRQLRLDAGDELAHVGRGEREPSRALRHEANFG
jgi:hypothetical protein